MSEIDEREEIERSIRERRAAVKIQSVFRGYRLRKEYSLRGIRNQAAKTIQRVWRKHIVRCKIQRVKEILAYFRLTRVVHSYRLRTHMNKERNRLMEVEQVLMFYNTMVYETGDVLGTYLYRMGIGQMKYSFTTAAGLFTSVIGIILLLSANAVAHRLGERGLW